MSSKKSFQFTSTLTAVEFGFIKNVVLIPQEIIVVLPRGRKKIAGLMNGAPFSLSIQFRRDGTQFIAVSRTLREAAAIHCGDPVKVVFSILDSTIHVNELETKLSADDDAGRVWNGFTADLQNSLSHYVNTVKKLDSRMRKSFEWVGKSKALSVVEPMKRKKTKN